MIPETTLSPRLDSTLQTGKTAFNDLISLIKEVKFPTKTPTPGEKDVGREKLEKALQNLKGVDSESLLLMGEIFTKYARLNYEDLAKHCMVMMRASLNAQLFAMGIYGQLHFETAGHKLDDLKKLFTNHEQFTAFDHFILSSDVDVLFEKIKGKNLTPYQLTFLGYTLSWMANSLHHTPGFRETENDQEVTLKNHKRFDQIYYLTEKVLLLAGTEEANLEIVELYYNGLRGVELRKDPKNLEAAHAWLDKGMAINTSLEYKARVANRKSLDYAKVVDVKNATLWLEEAKRIREEIQQNEQDPFLVANLFSSRAGVALKENNLDLAEDYIGKSLTYSESCRSARNAATDKLIDHNNDHWYFGLYDILMAEIKLARKDTKKALLYINRAIDTLEFHERDEIALALTLKAKVEAIK